MASSIEKMGIPVVQITAIPKHRTDGGCQSDCAGERCSIPRGDPSLSKEKERELRLKYILKALELLQKDVEGPTVVTLEGD